MQTQTLTAPPVTNNIPVLNSKQVIDMVRALLKQATHRVGAYPCAPSYQANMILINSVLVAMNDAEAVQNTRHRVKLIISQRRNLELLAPKNPVKWRETYLTKVESIMAACREYLGWEEQQ